MDSVDVFRVTNCLGPTVDTVKSRWGREFNQMVVHIAQC